MKKVVVILVIVVAAILIFDLGGLRTKFFGSKSATTTTED